MKILLQKAYFYPEIAASMYITENLLEEYSKNGIHTEIHVPMPTRGVSKECRKEYKKKKIEVTNSGMVVIKRYAMFNEGKNPVRRAFRYFLCHIVQIVKALKARDIDVLFYTSTPPTQMLAAAIVKKIKKIPVIYNLQDIFPDSLISTGLTKGSSLIWKLGRHIENYSYRKADKIIVISEDFKKNIMNKGVPEEKIEVVYNWVDENAVVNIARENNKLADAYHLDKNKFIITYCGNIGLTQNMDMLLDAAKDMEVYADICFVLIGEGAYKANVEKQIAEKSIKNTVLIPFQPYEDISHVFSLGDVGLIISKENIGQNSVPSKTWSIMSAERPTVASFDMNSELCSIIKKADCGLCAQAGDKEGLKEALLDLYRNRQKAMRMGQNGRKFIMENLTRSKGTSRYVQIIMSLMKRDGDNT